MPYRSNLDLPPGVRLHLPEAAQSIYRNAFNHAWATYKGHPRQEEIVHRIAWAAVKKRFVKIDTAWVARASRANDSR